MPNMRNVLGLVFTEKNNVNLGELTTGRAPAALPVAGRYRLIDFILSNMVNSGIENIGVTTHHHYSSLMDHLGSGKEWDLARKNNGLFILPPYNDREEIAPIKGDIDVLYGVTKYLKKSRQDYVVLANGVDVCNIDLEHAFDFHIKNQADITIVYKNEQTATDADLSNFTLLEIGANKEVLSVEVNPRYPKCKNASLEIYIMEKALLESIIDECHARSEHDFVSDAIVKKIGGLRVFAYEFCGFVGRIFDVRSYYVTNMMFLSGTVRDEMLLSRPIYTKVKDEPPTTYLEEAYVENSLIADGCTIDGTVQNCIVFRNVKVSAGAVAKNCILMQGTKVGASSTIECAVTDKEVVLGDGKCLVGQPNYPIIVAKGTKI